MFFYYLFVLLTRHLRLSIRPFLYSSSSIYGPEAIVFFYRPDVFDLCSDDGARSAGMSGGASLVSGDAMRFQPPYAVDKYIRRFVQRKDRQCFLNFLRRPGLNIMLNRIAHNTAFRARNNHGTHWDSRHPTQVVAHYEVLNVLVVRYNEEVDYKRCLSAELDFLISANEASMPAELLL